jgi:hypothetical protein
MTNHHVRPVVAAGHHVRNLTLLTFGYDMFFERPALTSASTFGPLMHTMPFVPARTTSGRNNASSRTTVAAPRSDSGSGKSAPPSA